MTIAVTPGSGANFKTTDTGGEHVGHIHINTIPVSKGAGAVDATTTRVVIANDTVNSNGRAAAADSAPVVLSTEDKAALDAISSGLSVFRSLDLDESEEQVKATAGKLHKLRIANLATSPRYVKLYNATAANVTVGTTTPIDTIVVPAASSSDACVITEHFGPKGLTFDTALSLAATTGLADNNSDAPGANEVVVSAYYE